MKIPEKTLDPQTRLEYPSVYQAFMNSRHRYALLVGGAGSGKSYGTALKLLRRLIDEPGARILVLRKVGATLRRSVFQIMRDVIGRTTRSKDFKINLTERRIDHKPNGAALLFTGIDDPEKIKSIQGISSVWIEEATELDEADFRQLELRVRGATPGYKQFVLTCNPTSLSSWVYTRFCQPERDPDPDVLIVQTTVFDNPFADTDYERLLTNAMREDEHHFRTYTLGIWGSENRKDLFYKQFDLRRHVGAPPAPDPDSPLHLSFDFNVQPYLTCTAWQVDGNALSQIDELCLEGPRNTLPDMAAALLRRFGPIWPAGVHLYGDPSGNARSVVGQSPFQQLLQGLSAWQPTLRVAKTAEPVAVRGRWINHLLANPAASVQIRIAAHCRRTLEDYAQVREAPDGTKHKPRVRDRATGRSYEPHGHCSDANDYFLAELLRPSYNRFRKTGQL